MDSGVIEEIMIMARSYGLALIGIIFVGFCLNMYSSKKRALWYFGIVFGVVVLAHLYIFLALYLSGGIRPTLSP
jgi:hypothetical protein